MVTNNALNQSATGMQSQTTAGVFNGRTLAGTANQIAISNGDGISGNPTYSLTSTIRVSGISFNAGVTTLSTYTNGTFTPTIGATGTAPSVTYTTQIGRYTRIGNRAIMNIYIVLATFSGGTGSIRFASLPFTNNNATGNNPVAPIGLENVTFFAGSLGYEAFVGQGVTTALILSNQSAGAVLTLPVANVNAGSTFMTTITLEI